MTRKSLSLVFLLSGFCLSAHAQKAVLIDDDGTAHESTPSTSNFETNPDAITNSNTKTETTNTSIFDNKSAREIFEGGDYSSVYEMRAKRRVGLGVEAAGELGMLGVQAELNFAMDDSAVVGFGGGPQYSSFNVGWHHNFGGRAISPFTSVSYSRWYSNASTGSTVGDTTPSFLGQKFLTEGERESGRFAENFVIPGAGLQYNILSGPYAGTTIYAEAMLLVSMANLANTITGAFGAQYFF
jgi:hypothetical protein